MSSRKECELALERGDVVAEFVGGPKCGEVVQLAPGQRQFRIAFPSTVAAVLTEPRPIPTTKTRLRTGTYWLCFQLQEVRDGFFHVPVLLWSGEDE